MINVYFVVVDDYEIPGTMEFLVQAFSAKEARESVRDHYKKLDWTALKMKQIKARRVIGAGNQVVFLTKHVHVQAANYVPNFTPKVEYA